MPDTWVKAFARFETSEFVKEYFDASFLKYYLATKELELANLGRNVTSFEYESYLRLM